MILRSSNMIHLHKARLLWERADRLLEQKGHDPAYVYRLYCQSSQLGDPDGMFGVGKCYAEGIGVKRSQKGAFEWLSKSAALGCSSGICALGYAMRHGAWLSERPSSGLSSLAVRRKIGAYVCPILRRRLLQLWRGGQEGQDGSSPVV